MREKTFYSINIYIYSFGPIKLIWCGFVAVHGFFIAPDWIGIVNFIFTDKCMVDDLFAAKNFALFFFFFKKKYKDMLSTRITTL